MVRSWPALAPSPVRVVWTRSRPDSGPSLWAPAMLMASGYADARSPPLRPAEATITWRSRRDMWSSLRPALDCRPATTRRSPENRPHAAPPGRSSLAWAPGEDGPNLRRTTPKSPVRVANGRLGPWGSSAPRGTPVAFPSLARESLVLRPEGRLNLTAATAGCATHR